MAGRNAGVPEARRITFRIGINLGDVIVEGDDIYGGGVNVAARLEARLEALAEPGGICLSGTAYDTAYDKLDLVFEDLGEQQVKNIDQPVRTYRVVLDGEPGRGADAGVEPVRTYRVVLDGEPGRGADAGVDAGAVPGAVPGAALALPDKPSLAVLPFANMSAEPDQEFFADGISEDIITELSKFRTLFVSSSSPATPPSPSRASRST
jgi:hypothetical protein